MEQSNRIRRQTSCRFPAGFGQDGSREPEPPGGDCHDQENAETRQPDQNASGPFWTAPTNGFPASGLEALRRFHAYLVEHLPFPFECAYSCATPSAPTKTP